MVAVEKVRYTPDPENPNETIAIKEAWVESGIYGIRYVEISDGSWREKVKPQTWQTFHDFEIVKLKLS